MACQIKYDLQGNKIGVTENDTLFQEILNNPLNKNFDSALEIFLETYSGEFELNANNINGFYSNAEQSLLNLKDKNPKNVKGWISQLTDTQKNGGIKNVNQELEWIGLEDFLNEYVKENNPKAGNIPSSVVEDYIKSNQIEIVDVSKGGDFKEVSYQDIDKAELIPNDKYGGYYVYYKNGFIDKVYGVDSIDEAIFQSIRESNFAESDSIQPTKYEAYQLKGGENYREVLLTMPPIKDKIQTVVTSKFEVKTSNLDADRKEVVHNGFVLDEFYPNDGESAKDSYTYYYTKSGNFSQSKGELEENQEDISNDNYRSSHWSEKNILAHVRLNEKTLPDGRRVLILNEIQSDSGQAIKKDEDFILKEIENNFDNIYNKLLKSGIIKEDC